nr:heavy metal translocating P-type ATPase [Halopiger goleimassiliensis]
MERDHERADRCSLCGSPVVDAGGESAGEGEDYCSRGCRDVAASLAESDSAVSLEGSGSPAASAASDRSESTERDLDRTYLRVDGMYAATCESYLERVAESIAGVEAASASYVTESVRVDHDPEAVTPADLEDALSTLGYTAYRRDEVDASADDGATRRAREMTGLRKRRSEDLLAVRYVVGIVFGSFLLVPFVAVLYPVHLSAFSEWGVLEYYGDAFSSIDGLFVFPLFFFVTGVVLYLAGFPLLRGAYVSLRLRRPNTHLLAALTILAAFAYGSVALLQGRVDVYYDVTIVVASLVVAAVFYEALVKRRATDRLTDLTIAQVDDARRLEDDGTTTTVAVSDLESGDRVLVREGERIPVDGTLAEGDCTVDEAVVTGESLPVPKSSGDDVVGGSLVRSDAAVVAVGEETTGSIDRLTETVWDVQSADHGVGRRADALAATATPGVVGAAVLAGLGLYALGTGPQGVAMGVLLSIVVASPWGLAFAPPLTVAESVREALERGIVVFDESVFERLRAVDTVVFDKTGTLTTGTMTVDEADAPADLLAAAAALEERASHPAARAIAEAAADEATAATTVEAFHGHAAGVAGVVDGDRLLVGHPDLFREQGWDLPDDLLERVARARSEGRLPVVVGREGTAEGIVVVGDDPRPNWEATLRGLAETDVEVVVVTGDDAAATATFAAHPAVDRAFADVPPGGKTAAIRRLQSRGTVAMVGDGTNDAPALAAADLGISLGGGTDLASDAADLAILENDLTAVDRAFRLADAAGNRVRQNLALALSYNAIALALALAGVLTPVFVTGAIAVTAVLVGANAWRPLLE